MALQEKNRSSIYQSLVPVLGEEETQDLMSQFPTTDLGSPATKEYVGQECEKVRTEVAKLEAKIEHSLNRALVIMISAMGVGLTLSVTILSVVITRSAA
jgi:hypothetical protein